MKKNLMIVESPAKSKTIAKFLGKEFEIKASLGHVRDLPSYRLGVNIQKNFEPYYTNIKGKEKLLKELSASAEKAKTIYIATDPDREGEAIAWHIKEALKIPSEKLKRVVFNEITEHAVQEAVQHGRSINEHLVNAQQARRVLDRLIGYKLSPVLAKKIRRGLSAGRVQSVAVKIICDREKEILNFKEKEYWLIDAELQKKSGSPSFRAKLFAHKTESTKLEIDNHDQAQKITKDLSGADYSVLKIQTSKAEKYAPYPFITSTLQQEAFKKFSWTTAKTMRIAQDLYEGIDFNGESTGLITYMRTDSIRISDEAKAQAKSMIASVFGNQYIGKRAPIKKKAGVQDAHEAIRPSYLDIRPQDLSSKIPADHLKLYRLIWERFIASQMSPALIENTQVIITAKSKSTDPYFLKSTNAKTLFDGFTKLYNETIEDKPEETEEAPKGLPVLKESESLNLIKTTQEQKFTQPPVRYTEASLVKELEEKGIGRPSTYAPIISIIQERKYIEKVKKRLTPTELGLLVNDKLETYFANIVDVRFTAQMENKLDEIMEGKHIWQDIISEFYNPFEKLLANANEKMEKINNDKPTDIKCDKCGKPMVIKLGRYGEFLACSAYPECKNAKPIKTELNIPCPLCQKSIVEKKTKRGKMFYGCSGYPNCKFASWDKPINEACPSCKYPILVKKNQKNAKEKYCPSCKTKFTDEN